MRIVQCHGCFDVLHIGHIRHLQAAKKEGDRLYVTVTPDRFVNKGYGRPVFSEQLRVEAVRALACVDEATVINSPTAADAIRLLRPAVFAKGPDYSEATLDPGERAALAEVGARLVITDTPKWSSTALVPAVGSAAQQYLAGLRGRSLEPWLTTMRCLKVLVIGECIRDEYRYCDTLGKSGKEPILAAQFVRDEVFQGGSTAVFKHAQACADTVTLMDGPPITKRRFIERYPFQKLFEEYVMFEDMQSAQTPWLLETLPERLAEADLVVVADYGHGFLTPEVVGLLCSGAKFLAVNVQANAGNHGFSTISKYPRADFISLSERELRLDARDQTTDIRDVMRHRAETCHATVLITRGAHGCIGYDDTYGFAEAPALATHTVDRMGAGDAVFGVTACCASVGMPVDLITFMAAAVGTQAVGIVGNARYIEREALVTQIGRLLT